MVCYDGYILSHTFMPFDLPDQKTVDAFLPPFKPDYALRPEEPANLNTVTLPDVRLDVRGELAHSYMEIRYLLQEELRTTLDVAADAEKRFAENADRNDTVKFFFKLPDTYSIATPAGQYTPDWAVVVENGDHNQVYFVAETKGDTSDLQLREVEKAKIKCARRHFSVISSAAVKYSAVSS